MNLSDSVLKVLVGDDFDLHKKAAKKLHKTNYQQYIRKYEQIQCGQKFIVFSDCKNTITNLFYLLFYKSKPKSVGMGQWKRRTAGIG